MAETTTTAQLNDRATHCELKRAQLTIVQGPDQGQVHLLERRVTTLGRGSACQMQLTDPAVSGAHAEVVVEDQGFLWRDLDSTNGSYHDKLRIREAWLRPGVQIRLGQTVLRFEPLAGQVVVELSTDEGYGALIGRSVRMRELFAQLSKVAGTQVTLLLRGETGTGKDVIARTVHEKSARAAGPFVVLDCGAIPKTLMESTLFGHEKGAFTGADAMRVGAFEQAHRGTLFLDEIGELPLELQPKLLRVLESREVQKIGSARKQAVDVRVMAATHRDLRRMINEGSFREDLYHRLSIVELLVPPLRERKVDVALMADTFLEELRVYQGDAERFQITEEALQRLTAFSWPGNVRQLKNVIHGAVALADSAVLDVADLFPTPADHVSMPLDVAGEVETALRHGLAFKEAKKAVLDAFEPAYLLASLRKHRGNLTHCAQATGLTRYHLRELLKRYGLRPRG